MPLRRCPNCGTHYLLEMRNDGILKGTLESDATSRDESRADASADVHSAGAARRRTLTDGKPSSEQNSSMLNQPVATLWLVQGQEGVVDMS